MSEAITEKFDYAQVKRIMNEETNEIKAEAKRALDDGTAALKESVGLSVNPDSPAVAMAGNAAANIAAKWDNLSAEFNAFVAEIDKRIENANTVASTNQGFESTAQSTVGSGQ